MLYELLTFALRPFRRWWRRLLAAAVVGTLVVPLVRDAVDGTTSPDDADTVIDLPR